MLIPCRPAILDLEAITNTLAFLRTTGKRVAVVLNAVAPSGQDSALAEEALAARQVRTCPARLGRRIAFARALISGQTAQEFDPDGKAASEIDHVHTYVCDLVHTFTRSRNGAPSYGQQVR